MRQHPHIVVLYHSVGGSTRELAHEVAAGAKSWGCVDVSTLSTAAYSRSDRRLQEVKIVAADGIALGSPARFGNMSHELKRILDEWGPLWGGGQLAGKAYTAFATSNSVYGGSTAVIQSIYNAVCHFGGVIVPPGYGGEGVPTADINPYGTTFDTAGSLRPPESVRSAARYQGWRLAQYASVSRLLRPEHL